MAQFAPTNLTDDVCSPYPYIASASSEFSFTFRAAAAFSSSTGSTYWVNASGSSGYLQIDLGVDFNGLLTSYSIQVNTIPEPTRAPKDWTMQGSNDGSSWTTLDTESGQISWASGETRTFSASSSGIAYRFFRLNITANNGASLIQVANLLLFGTPGTNFDLAPHNMTANNLPSPYVASASSTFGSNSAFHAFDGALGLVQYWIGTGGGVDWLQLDIGAGRKGVVTSYYVQASLENEPLRMPKDFTLQGSNDGSTWTVLDTEAGQTGWGNGEVRGWPVSGASYYRYYRLNITANNGDATFTDVGEMYLLGFLAPSAAQNCVVFVCT